MYQSGVKVIKKYFPYLSTKKYDQFEALGSLYTYWNEKINLISRKDISNIYTRHILHSLGIAKIISFHPGTKILDVGSGGGFPGIPLAVLFPQVSFHLIDSIQKKVAVLEDIVQKLGLENVTTKQIRVEKENNKYDFVVSRAVTALPKFYQWTKKNIKQASTHPYKNGILYLKGGNLQDELYGLKADYQIFSLSRYYEEDFFKNKVVVYIHNSS